MLTCVDVFTWATVDCERFFLVAGRCGTGGMMHLDRLDANRAFDVVYVDRFSVLGDDHLRLHLEINRRIDYIFHVATPITWKQETCYFRRADAFFGSAGSCCGQYCIVDMALGFHSR